MSALRTGPGSAAARHERLHGALPSWLGVPLPVLFAWGGLGTIAALVVSTIALRGAGAVAALEEDEVAGVEPTASLAAASSSASQQSTAAPAQPPAPAAPSAELEAATLAGADALARLAEQFPEDPAVAKALFLSQAANAKTYPAAVRAARRLHDLAPGSFGDAEVRRALLTIATRPATGPTDTSTLALDMMASEMGAPGAELLFEVATGSSLLPKTKAAALLKDPDVRKHACPELLFAAELAGTLPCARKALLDRAAREGDARSLPFLKPLLNTACSSGLRSLFGRSGAECYRCYSPADRARVQAVVDAIGARAAPP